MTDLPKKKCGKCFGQGFIFGKNCPKCNPLKPWMPQPDAAFNARWAATNGSNKGSVNDSSGSEGKTKV